MRMPAWFKQVVRRAPPALPPVHECILGIPGLPADAAGLTRGAITAVVGANEALDDTLLRGTLALNLGHARIALLSMGTDGAEFDALLASTPRLRPAVDDGSLQLLHASPRCAELVGAHGPDVLLDELAVAGMNQVDLLVISHAERLLDPADAQSTRAMVLALRAMLASSRQSLLLLFDDAGGTLAAPLTQALDMFPNLAFLENAGGLTLLSVLRWQARASLTSDIRYRLARAPDSGWLVADGSVYVAQAPEPEPEVAPAPLTVAFEEAAPLPPMDSRCGYMAPRDFLRIGTALMARPEHVGLHTLYRLPLRSDVAHLDALRSLAAFQQGELATADQHHIHILLFGRAPDSFRARLRQLIGQAPSVWFTGLQTWQSEDEIATRLALLQVALHTSRLPDYSAMLGLHRRDEAAGGPMHVSPVPDVYQGEPAPAAVEAAAEIPMPSPVAARTVHAHPLKLRGKIRPPRIAR